MKLADVLKASVLGLSLLVLPAAHAAAEQAGTGGAPVQQASQQVNINTADVATLAGRDCSSPPVSAAPSISQTMASAYPLWPANVSSAPIGDSNSAAGLVVGRPSASIIAFAGTGTPLL